MLHIRTSFPRILYKNLQNSALLRQSSTKASATWEDADSSGSKSVQDRSQDSGGLQSGAFKKLRARRPLVKNFFVGVVDKELLGYPETIARDEMANLHNHLLPLKSFFTSEVDPKQIDATRSIAPATMDGLRELGVYSFNVPEELEGRGWEWSASLMASEPEASCTDIAISLLSHRVVIDTLKEVGSDEQKQRWLTKLGQGSLVASEAVFEFSPPEDDFFNTTALHNSETGQWTLNGEKSFVVCGPKPSGADNLFLVIAQTQRPALKGDLARGTTVFLVDSNTAGVKLGEQHLQLGCRGVQMHRVKFDNVKLSESSVLGHANEGNVTADSLLRAGRLRTSMIGLGMAKNVLNELAVYCNENKQSGVSLKDMEMNQAHLSQALCSTYATESIIYMTAGMMDEFHGQDVNIETAIAKYHSLKELLKIATKHMDVIGPKSLHSGQPSEVALRNATQLYALAESIDSLKMYIALMGLQHAGVLTNDTIRKQRNPLFHPGHIFSKFLERSNFDNPNTTKMRLAENLHPTLEPAAQCIEHSVARLQMCVELLLTRYGSNVVERHSELGRLADAVTTIYAMFASISRASRSYCIGLPLADHELLTATTICVQGRETVRNTCTEILNGQFMNNDNNLMRLAGQLAKSKGYFPTHPLTYNF